MTISNKKIGNNFEKSTAEYLSENDFWVYRLPNKIGGQPFDILALKNDTVIALDCKVCSNDVFDKSRIEDNQHTAMNKILKCVSKAKVGFYFLFNDGTECFAGYNDIIKADKRNLKKDDLLEMGGKLIAEDKNL